MAFTVKCTHWDTEKLADGIKKCKLCNLTILTDYSLSDTTVEWESKE